MTACYCDYDPPSWYSQRRRTAAKPHRCSECSLQINAGEQYEDVRGCWDGEIDRFKTCVRCLALREYVVAHVPCFCWSHGDMIEEALQTVEAFAHEAPGLTFGALRLAVAIRCARSFGTIAAMALSRKVEGDDLDYLVEQEGRAAE